MLNMPQINSIKEMARDGQSVAGIARELAIDEKTVRKYLKQEDFSPHPPEDAARPSKLDPHKPLIDTWLEEDQGRWYKQRHTAKRIHDRLKAESPGYGCAYNAVQRYVKDRLSAQRALRASQELVWPAFVNVVVASLFPNRLRPHLHFREGCLDTTFPPILRCRAVTGHVSSPQSRLAPMRSAFAFQNPVFASPSLDSSLLL